MKMRFKMAVPVFAALLLLCGCSAAPTEPETTAATQPIVTEISLADSNLTIADLDVQFPGMLKKVDMTGCTDYAEIEAYAASHPQTEVHYTVSLGSRDFAPDTKTITLEQGDYEYPMLMQNLKYLHSLESVRLNKTMLLPGSIQNLRDAYPNIQLDYTVMFCGEEIDGDTVELDVSALDPEGVVSEAEKLNMLPYVQFIELMDADGNTQYSLEQAARLQECAPNAMLRYTFDLFGKTVSTTDEEVSYQGQNIGNKEGALDTLRMALTIMHGCERFVLDNCKFSNETLAQLRDEFRGRTKIVWRVWFADGGCLTDRKIIYYIYGLYDWNCENLVYCEDAEFIDFGHNEYLKTCEFVKNMKNLKAIILSGSMVADLTPFAGCESLEFLELAFCGYLEDISPLANCRNLKRLNIAFTKVADLTPLDNLEMDVMVDARSNTDPDMRAHFDSLHPTCLIQHTGDVKDDQPYGCPWRYDEKGDANEYYAILKEKFNYPHPSNTLW